jgi:hypothetical protein
VTPCYIALTVVKGEVGVLCFGRFRFPFLRQAMDDNWLNLIVPLVFLALLAIAFVAGIVGVVRELLSRCPGCERRSWKVEVEEKKIPGSERKVEYMPTHHEGLRREIRADFMVTYMCRYCGYELSETQTRTIKTL